MTAPPDRARLLTGTALVEPAPRILVAGKLEARFAGGNLRSIRYDGIEVLRAISFLVRDRDWGTYSPELRDIDIAENGDGFVVVYTARCEGPGSTALEIAARITGTAAGELAFEGSASTATGFETNRCGFCILHPIVGVAGTPVTVEHVDGAIRQTMLPDLIEPWQPFRDMRAITHEVAPGLMAECRMQGDTFEMEDQRNWSDASYKTYVRPLALPWPYRIAPNETVLQTVRLTISGAAAAADPMHSPVQRRISALPVALHFGEKTGVMPMIGLVVTPEQASASLAALPSGIASGAEDLLLHFDPLAGHGIGALQDFARLAEAHPGTATLEIALACKRPPDAELREIAAMMQASGLDPDAVIVSPAVDRQSTPPGSAWPDCPPLDDVYGAARAAFPDVRLGGGMLSYFTELNRKRVPAHDLDFVTHATNPIVHAADDVSVMQTLEGLPFITRSFRAIYGDMPYRIGPSTIAMRQNPYGGRTMDNPDGGRIPMADRDPRHNALFGAAFALGYAASVVGAGLERLTLSALTGPFGLIAGPGEPMPDGRMRPLAQVVADLSRLSGRQWRDVLSSSPSHLLALSASDGKGGTTLLMANITADTVSADLSGLDLPAKVDVALLDEHTAVALSCGNSAGKNLTGSTLEMRPYATARLSWTVG